MFHSKIIESFLKLLFFSRLQPSIIYPANTLFGSNVIPGFGGGAGLNQAQHYTTAYDLAQFGAASQLSAADTAAANGYPYGTAANAQTNQNALANAAAIAQLANANSYYAALASQAISAPSALAAFQQ